MLLVILIFAFIAVGGGLTWYLLAKDQGKKEPIGALWLVAGFGVLAAVVSATAEHFLIPQRYLSPLGGQPLTDVLIGVLAVGAIEECAKFIPAALFLWHKPYFRNHVDGVIYFAIVGLAFGIPENILYSIQYGAKAGAARLLLDPLFHASVTAMVGYALGKAKVDQRSLGKTVLTLLAAILIHALYDFGLFSRQPILLATSASLSVALAFGLFVFFIRAKELDREDGLAVVGHNNFCRSCGQPNPKHYLFCTHCGAHA